MANISQCDFMFVQLSRLKPNTKHLALCLHTGIITINSNLFYYWKSNVNWFFIIIINKLCESCE